MFVSSLTQGTACRAPVFGNAPSPPPGEGERGSVLDRLLERGVSRRSFLTWCAAVTGTLALPPQLAPRVAAALTQPDKPTLLWLEFQDCTGDTESFLRARNPSVSQLVLDVLSVDYHETIMAAAGRQAEEARATALERGNHLLVVEGSVPLGADGAYCTIGGRSARQILEEASRGAAAILNVGTCAAFGGLPAARPNPTHAVAVGDVVSGVPMLNLPGCPVNADNLTAAIVHYLTFKQLPATDDQGRPLFAYGQRIHDNCPRRGFFDAGQFALAWGDEGHRKGWCLYRLGCKGPSTWHNCPVRQWNASTSWPIGAGHGCVGCSEAGFWDTMTPFYDRLPHARGLGLESTAEEIGVAVVAGTAGLFATHGVGKAVQHRVQGRREERKRDEDYTSPPAYEPPDFPPAEFERRQPEETRPW
ncbi:MAG TPA: hydrogenase small subunit [Mycobacteriales bacterium]|nr:hydrogenase small subunit [Mycobacteriales bacterium]